MLKMLVLYRRLLLGALTTMAVYVAIVVAGVWLTDLSLFETYVFATPLLSMALPAMFGGGSMANLFSTHPPLEERIARLQEMSRQAR